ncbi:MAG: sarcosine oxidase subunit gamma SoxG [Desulfamplus sp.]|nr:sarcosine oxidase subunit gamma SoxG [Desulfamplus sp.]
MVEIKRYSPVSFKASPKRTEIRDNFTVVLEYEGEGQQPFDPSNSKDNYIVDLSHITRFDVQSSNLDDITPFGIKIPQGLCESYLQDSVLINRMNRVQASIFCLPVKKDESSKECQFDFQCSCDSDCKCDPKKSSAYTETTEVGMCMAIFGKNTFSITEKLTSLDFLDPVKKTPFLYQGPMSHIPCQIITLSRDGAKSGIIFTASRGYGKDMTHAIMDAGAEFGLKPAGEDRFKSWAGSL